MAMASEPPLLYLIKQVELAAKARIEEVVSVQGLTSGQYTALTVLRRNPGITSARLARNSFVRLQSMAQMLGALEGMGLVRRERDPHNRRQFLVFLTPAGVLLIDSLDDPVGAIEREMLDGLGEARTAELTEMLRTLRHRLSGTHPH